MPIRQVESSDHIYQRLSKEGVPINFIARVRTPGFARTDAAFQTLEEAESFVLQTLAERKSQPNVSLAQRITVGQIIDEAIADIDSGRRDTKGAATERLRLMAFKRDFYRLCNTTLQDATEDKFEDWMADRLEEVKPNTVLRELRLFRPLFAKATRKFDLQRSPVQFIKPPRMVDDRVRRISPDEEALLFFELKRAKEPVVPLAATFALETGCRRSEQLRIEWDHYDPKSCTVWLADAKNGRGRYILLTAAAQQVLETISGPKIGRIFDITGNQLRKAFEYARIRASMRARRSGREYLVEIKSLRWHDFRHEAISRCFDAGWTSEQVMDFSGHVDIKSLLRYRHPSVDLSVARLRALERQRGLTSVAFERQLPP